MFHAECEFSASRAHAVNKRLGRSNTAHDQHAPEASDCVLQVIARALISLEVQSSVENIASDVIDRTRLGKIWLC